MMEMPSDTQLIEPMSDIPIDQINPEETSQILEPDISFGDFTFDEDLDKFSSRDITRIPSTIASQIECQIETLPQSLQDVTLGGNERLEPSVQQSSNASLASQDPFEMAERYLEKHSIMQVFQIQDIIRERDRR